MFFFLFASYIIQVFTENLIKHNFDTPKL